MFLFPVPARVGSEEGEGALIVYGLYLVGSSLKAGQNRPGIEVSSLYGCDPVVQIHRNLADAGHCLYARGNGVYASLALHSRYLELLFHFILLFQII